MLSNFPFLDLISQLEKCQENITMQGIPKKVSNYWILFEYVRFPLQEDQKDRSTKRYQKSNQITAFNFNPLYFFWVHQHRRWTASWSDLSSANYILWFCSVMTVPGTAPVRPVHRSPRACSAVVSRAPGRAQSRRPPKTGPALYGVPRRSMWPRPRAPWSRSGRWWRRAGAPRLSTAGWGPEENGDIKSKQINWQCRQ